MDEAKVTADNALRLLRPKLEALSTFLHSHPELGLQEEKACRMVADLLREEGFDVETGVAGLSTCCPLLTMSRSAGFSGRTGPLTNSAVRHNTLAVVFIVLVIIAAHLVAPAAYSWRENTISGVFSTEPFVHGMDYSALEAQLHSVAATGAGVGISLGVLLYMLSESTVRTKIAHLVALVLIAVLSVLFGAPAAAPGVVQRLLYVVGFVWLIYVEARATRNCVARHLPAWASIPGGLLVSAISDRLADRLAPLRFLLPATALTLFGIVTVGGGPSLYALLILYGLLGKATVDPPASTVPRLPGPTAPLSRRGDCR